MKIRCISCGHNFELGDAYDDYEGEVKCWVCGAILEVKMHEGMLKFSRHASTHDPLVEETIERTL